MHQWQSGGLSARHRMRRLPLAALLGWTVLPGRSRPAGRIPFLTVRIGGACRRPVRPGRTAIGVLFLSDWKALLRQLEPAFYRANAGRTLAWKMIGAGGAPVSGELGMRGASPAPPMQY